MKGGTRIAIGVGIGYVLGRTRKMRFALALVGASMAKRSSGVPGALLEQGTSLLKSSPEFAQLTDTVRGELMGAVRSAAVTAASNRIDTLNARLQQGSTLVSDVSPGSGEAGDEDARDEEISADENLEHEDHSETERGESDERDREKSATRAGRQETARTRKTTSRAPARRAGSADRRSASSTRRRSHSDADAPPVRRTGR
ncbi:hypothetical protein [Nocardia vaccinii]|uniref:hypothetical protein n=1 Tax=Nocardia vaccinii TaxID=1822 RepID=UPI00082968BD|nr:hypothetical protein [Nocardia vaccinii]